MITSETWEDEFFTGLSMFNRLLWIGLITSAADDQGRMQDNAALLRSKVFPLDDVSLADIEAGLSIFCKAHKIERYIANGKKCIQIIAWWKHQTPRWAGHSILPNPVGWVDRERYHGPENKLITNNWDSTGGYIADYTINDVKDDVKDDDDDEKAPTPSSPPNFRALSENTVAEKVYLGVTGMSSLPGPMIDKTYELWKFANERGGIDRAVQYLKPFYDDWVTRKTKDGRLYSKTGAGWMDWAIAGEAPKNGTEPKPLSGRESRRAMLKY